MRAYLDGTDKFSAMVECLVQIVNEMAENASCPSNLRL